MEIKRITNLEPYLADLIALLQNAVDGGASIGFLPPLVSAEARAYWLEVNTALQGTNRVMLIALEHNLVVGTVQLDLVSRANGLHRAEVAKLMVHSDFRRQGIAQALLQQIELEALQQYRTTLILDTRVGDPSENLYTKFGWQKAGVIPEYIRSETRLFDATVYMYRLLLEHHPITVEVESVYSEDAANLINQLTLELRGRYPEDPQQGAARFKPEDLDVPNAAFVVARVGGVAVGCAAIRPLSADTTELKRMFVHPNLRGRGLGAKILLKLEQVAPSLGMRTIRLETGDRNPEAVALYEKNGYSRISAFPPYEDDTWSICMEKILEQ